MALTSTRYTYDFVAANLPQNLAQILEIGCGEGELAAVLQADGLKVVAIDSDPDAVEAARARGVDARLTSWPAPLSMEFDAILFTRSLHHIHELDEAIAEARRVLNPSGRIVVEDFRAEGGGAASAAWFADWARQLLADGALTRETTLDVLIEKLATSDHHLHSSTDIAAALASFAVVEAYDAAYYFRYLEPHLRQSSQAQQLLEEEMSLIGAGSIEPLGKRFVACDR